jgi:hypothetical protein
LTVAACKNDPEQVEVVQNMASALGRKGPEGMKAACTNLVIEQQNPMGCDNLLVPLLHYAPGFAGSQISRRGPSHQAFWSQIAKVPLHYEGPHGSGNLMATLQHEDGKWHVYSYLPVP